MRVINIVISNKDAFEESLIRELIKKEISYVQIDDEFHFNNKIYRFFDSKLDKEKIEELLKNSEHIVKEFNRVLNFYKLPSKQDSYIEDSCEVNVLNNHQKIRNKKNQQFNKTLTKEEIYYRNKRGKVMSKRFHR